MYLDELQAQLIPDLYNLVEDYYYGSHLCETHIALSQCLNSTLISVNGRAIRCYDTCFRQLSQYLIEKYNEIAQVRSVVINGVEYGIESCWLQGGSERNQANMLLHLLKF